MRNERKTQKQTNVSYIQTTHTPNTKQIPKYKHIECKICGMGGGVGERGGQSLPAEEAEGEKRPN